MNVEKLYLVLRMFKSDYDELKIREKIRETLTLLSQARDSPNDPNISNKFKEKYPKLLDLLDDCESNDATPTELKLMEELGINNSIGIGLKGEIIDIISRNNITPSIAVTELEKLLNELDELYKTTDSLINSFAYFNLEFDVLKDNEYEIGLSIPETYMKSNLQAVTKEMQELDKALKTINEISADDTSSFEIKSISKSVFQISFVSVAATASFIAIALERITNIYKNILEIKVLKDKLAEKKVPKKLIAPLEEFIKERVKLEVDIIAENLVKEYYKKENDGRKNELITSLKNALGYIAERINKGATFEVRGGKPKSPVSEEGIEETPEYKKALNEYNKRIKEVNELNRAGRVLTSLSRGDKEELFLPEPPEEEKKEN